MPFHHGIRVKEMKETEKKIRARIAQYGGVISQMLLVEFPKTLRINSRQEAIDILDILINDQDNQGNTYTMEMDILLLAIKNVFKRKVI